ncbi:hypothetical protein [Nocardiopsis sp. FR4]|uniref:hypothetical protein n=1 Tax=Nocardiopsis sp. FR4 TaxID=2605985 RepID=UPI00135A57F3|nr:hypothetical protein [Nocardiopsis sp. FR4]
MSMPVPLPFEEKPLRQAPRKVTADQLLDVRESEWRPRLDGVSLVSEAAISPKELRQAALALGKVFTARLNAGMEPRLHRWPACTAAVTVGIATAHYSGGKLWPDLWKHTGVPRPRQANAEWGNGFLRSLDVLGLEPFTDDTQYRYVGPMVMHSGIPTYCLKDLFDLILHRVHADPGLDAHGLHQWALGGQFRLRDLDKPAQRFLSSGRDYALETIERCMHLLELLQDDADATCREAGLPERFRAPAVRALEEAGARGALPAWNRSASARRRSLRPSLGLDPYVHGVHVQLPADEYGDDVRWNIVTDEDSHSVRQRWTGGERTVFTLPRPTRSVSVAPHRTDAWHRLTLVDPDDPLLLFTEDGALVSTDLALPPGSVWALYPGERTLARSGDVRVAETGEAPYGWRGWELVRLHTERGSWLGLEGGRVHRIQGRARPEVELSDPVPGVTTVYGAPVHARPPAVLLPEDTGSAVAWDVDVLFADSGRVLARATGTGGDRVHPFDGLPSPVLGSFTVRVRGPLGRGTQLQVAVAEGLTATHEPGVRILRRGGLAPGRSELTAPEGLRAEPAVHGFDHDQTSRAATLSTGTAQLPVTIRPPHLRVLSTGGHTPRWSAEPLRLDTEAVGEAGDLLVRLPEGDDPGLLGDLCVREGVRPLQWVRARKDTPGNTVRYPLAQVTDTATAHPSLELVVGYAARVVPLASVRPRRLATGVRHQGGDLLLEGFVGAADVSAAVYTQHAPWRGPEVFPVTAEGRIALPEDGRVGGPLLVVVAVEDPWAVTDWPRWPDAGTPNLLSCSVPGRPHGTDEPEEALCRALAAGDLSEAAREGGANAVRLWRMLGVADRLRASDLAEHTVVGARRALAARPLEALVAHPDADLSPQRSVSTLVSSGVVAAPLGERPDPAWAAGLWSRLPVAACLAGGHVLARCDLDAPESGHADFLEQMEQRCGHTARRILEEGGRDPAHGTGRFDAATESMTALSPERFEALWQAARVVPRALLDGDSRSNAAMGLFTIRDSARLRLVRKHGADIVHPVLRSLTRLRPHHQHAATALVGSRHTPDARPWLNLPAVSLAMAVTARLAARGFPLFASLAQAQRRTWTALAEAAPDLVATDIVLAELTLSGAERTPDHEEQT